MLMENFSFFILLGFSCEIFFVEWILCIDTAKMQRETGLCDVQKRHSEGLIATNPHCTFVPL
jgi:hypothetical protein